MTKYTNNWYSSGLYEPDYRSIHILNELCANSNTNTRALKFIAFNLVNYLDLAKLTDAYIRNPNVTPIQMNDLLMCILNLLTEFCLRDQIRESSVFERTLRPVYNQAEVLPHWSMLSDNSYASVVLDKFCAHADYRYALASRGTERGLLINLLKSAAEFYTITSSVRNFRFQHVLKNIKVLIFESELNNFKGSRLNKLLFLSQASHLSTSFVHDFAQRTDFDFSVEKQPRLVSNVHHESPHGH